MNTRTITAALVALTMIVMAASPLMNDTNELQPNAIVEFDHGGGLANGTAILGGMLNWQDDAWNATWNCSGGLALVTPSDWSNFVASGDNDPHNYTSWGMELSGAGSYYTENAPEGEWVVTAGLGCMDDAGEPRAAGGQYGDVHENPPTVNLTNGTTVGDVSFTLIEHGGGGGPMETILINSVYDVEWDDEVYYEWSVYDLAPDANYTVEHLIYTGPNSSISLFNYTLIGSDGDEQMHADHFVITDHGLPADGCFMFAVMLYDADDGHLFDGDFQEFSMGDAECDDGPPSPQDFVDMFDTDGDGVLSLDEIIDGINNHNNESGEPPLTAEEEGHIGNAFNDSDDDGSGTLDLDELEYFIELIEGDDGDEPTFVCGDGEEIPFSWVNDGEEDCDDGSDEPQDFDGDGVTDNWFDCHDGSNISMDLVNDGNDDCPDGEDEGGDDIDPDEIMEMLDSNGDWNLTLQEILDFLEEDEGPLTQEEEDFVEDGFNESDADGNGLLDIDELEHFIDLMEEYDDGGLTFVCGDGEEIPFSWVNDGEEDCDDGSDEPQDFDGDGVTDNWFDCHDGTNVSMDLVNDGNDDCPDGEDEGKVVDDDDTDCSPSLEISFQQNADNTADLTFTTTCVFNEIDSAELFSDMDSDGDGVLNSTEIEAAQDEMANETCHDENGTEVPCGDDDDDGVFSYDGTVMTTQPMVGDSPMSISVDAAGIITMTSIEVISVTSNSSLDSHTLEYDAGADWDGGNDECMGGVSITATSPWSVSNVSFAPTSDWIPAMYADGTGWYVQNTDADGDGHCNSQPSSVEIVFTPVDDGGDDDGPDCEYLMEISFLQMADDTAELTFTNTCTFDAAGSADMISWLDTDGDGTLSPTEIAAAQDEMANQTCYDGNGTEVPCGDDDDDGLFSFDGTVMVTQPMDDTPMTISEDSGIISMSSTEVISVPSDSSLYSHTFEYDAGADWDGGNDECMGGVSITASSPWSVSNVSFAPTSDWIPAMYADGSGWIVDNFDADEDGHCNSEPSSVVIVFTTPEPEPVVDTTPVCDIYYNVGGAVLTAGSTWSVQVQGAVSFEVPSNGEYTLALPVGEYSVILACEDAEGDAIVVSVTDGTETWGGTAQDGVIYAEGLFTITEDNVSESVDITLTWSSTDFGGTFNTHFTAVESVADAIEETDTGGLPGFTSILTITAMLGAAMILTRRKD